MTPAAWAIFSGPTRYISLATATFVGIGMYTVAFTLDSVALPVAIVVTLLVEILTSIEGIGALMIGAQRNFQSPQVYGLLVLIGLFGLLVNNICAVFEAILLRRWPPKTQSENF